MSFNTLTGIELTLRLADTSALAAIHRALRGCRVRSQDPCSFVTVHNRSPSLSRRIFPQHLIQRLHQKIRILLSKHHRRLNLQHIMKWPIRT